MGIILDEANKKVTITGQNEATLVIAASKQTGIRIDVHALCTNPVFLISPDEILALDAELTNWKD